MNGELDADATPSPVWSGSSDSATAIREWALTSGFPHEITLSWAGQHGWEMGYRRGGGYFKLTWGNRLVVTSAGLSELNGCLHDWHVLPHRGESCILR